ncbi:MAG TPA: acyl-CoA synthetase, partial [Gemmatimonadota bacterium]|nr:acyl-CoA synthetase [Gemmatimonadota bacterium]
ARVALVDARGEHGYGRVLSASAAVAARLRAAGVGKGERVALLVTPGLEYTAALLGTWRAGAVAVPLSPAHPPPELAHVLGDSGAVAALAGEGRARTLERPAGTAGARVLPVDLEGPAGEEAAPPAAADAALVLYTSGTTSRPKGVVLTHAHLEAQVGSLVEAWAWSPDDRLLHALPLHHTHGIVNGLLCALRAGATCDHLARFDASEAWAAFAARPVTLFMGVPTMYVRLIRAWEEAPPETRAAWTAAAAGQRVMISGSAALPVTVFERWREIAGHALLERYGMTEIGMALSNPLDGERRPGTVGVPLPAVRARLVDESGDPVAEGAPGGIEIAGPAVFTEYLNRPEETTRAFRDGWFRTGDEAVVERGYWRILGRSSVDILKTGGYKVSALEIEDALLAHPEVAECAVVGAPDPEWGERVCAAVVAAPGAALEPDALRAWAKERLAPYKAPARVLLVRALPRNAMGKVTKPTVRGWFEAPATGASETKEEE